jgi:carboxypeptidase T
VDAKLKLLMVLLIPVLIWGSVNSLNYKKVKIYLSGYKDITLLAQQGFAMDDARFDKKENSISIFLNDNEFEILKSMGLRYNILIDDWHKYYSTISKSSETEDRHSLQKSSELFGVSGFGYGSMGGHYTLKEVNDKLDSIHLQYPLLTTEKFQIGTSVENRPIYAIKISDNPDESESEPQVLFTALTHAREPQGMMNTIYYMYYLLENYGKDPEVTYLINNRQIFFVPLVNVDGYEYNRSIEPNGGGMWRKNRRSPDGIDLNRNYGYMWGSDDIGSSPSQYSEVYRGSSAFSEPETQAIRDFCNSHNFKVAFNYHTYGNLLVIPWGYSNTETPDSAIYNEFSSDVTRYNKYTWGVGTGTVGYTTNGDADDWMYGEQTTKNKTISFTPEVGNDNDGFWAPKSRILPIAEENLFPNLYLTWVAGGYVNLLSYSLNKQNFIPGDVITLTANFKNKGLSRIDNVSAQIISLSPDIVINNPNLDLGSVSSRTEVGFPSAFTFTISPSANLRDPVKLNIKTFAGDVTMSSDTISFLLGIPQYAFEDSANDINKYWSTSGNGNWTQTTSTFHSSPDCYTESKNGNYLNNADVEMTLKDEISLSDFANPVFTFWTKYDIEPNFDYGIVKFSTDNGTSWFTLPGKYNNLSTGNFQPAGEYVYDGTQTNWVKEEINLSSLIGMQVKIKFEFHSDQYEVRDGWYIDDIALIHYVKEQVGVPDKDKLDFVLEQNYPNPFNPSTTIKYSIPTSLLSPSPYQGEGHRERLVTLKVYNILGREVATLVNKEQSPGNYSVDFNATSLSSGVYFYQLKAGNFIETRKLVLMR